MKKREKQLVDKTVISTIRNDLNAQHSQVYFDAFTDMEARQKLREILLEKNYVALGKDEVKIEYVVQELVGLGVIEEIIRDNDFVTDITFNGTDLVIETNHDKWIYEKDVPRSERRVDEEYITKIVMKMANAAGKGFSPKEPILDVCFNNYRLNAVHNVVAKYGTTMALRVTRPVLALNEQNFESFAPRYVLELLRVMVLAGAKIVICGEVGTGKTELQKFLTSMIPFYQKIVWIEDVLEGHVKTLFPDKDIHSWLTGGAVTITDLISAALRNHAKWINVAEVRGEESYEMMQAVFSGHSIILGAHAPDAHSIPSRIINMAKMGYQFDEATFRQDIYKHFDFGIHLKKTKRDGVVRYLAEIVEYLDDCKSTTVFEQKETKNGFASSFHSLSNKFKERLEEHHLQFEFPKKEEGEMKHEIA